MVSILEYKERDIANKQLWPFMGTVMIKTLFASIVLLASLGLSGNALAGTLLNLNYSDFSSTNGLTLLGTAQQVNGNALQLTTNGVKNSAGGVFFNTPVGVSRFNAEFTFQFFNTYGADGMAFVIKNADSWGTGAGGLGEYGGALGYGGGTNGIQKSVGIEFDSSVNTKILVIMILMAIILALIPMVPCSALCKVQFRQLLISIKETGYGMRGLIMMALC